MASHVVVIDSAARRATVKTTPEKHLTDILQEACQKLGRDVDSYGLKNNNKIIDLSRTIRLSGLSSGAKLELVLQSRSPSVVTVALNLLQPEPNGTNRLIDKFPSTTTLWLVLRKFESAGATRNFTARGVPQTQSEGSGAGRLYFETPVIQIMGRELLSFTDLQKTLAQLGFNSGNTLLRLNFRKTDKPLEEAMEEIDGYFKSVRDSPTGAAHESGPSTSHSIAAVPEPILPDDPTGMASPPEPQSPPASLSVGQTNENHSSALPSDESSGPKEPGILVTSATGPPSSIPIETVLGPSQRPMSVFALPSSNTPKAAMQAFDEKDYEPTVAHARLQQSRLAAAGRNQRLLTDKELAAEAEGAAKRNANAKEVEIKIRFPDQSTVVSKFTNVDTAISLYGFVRELLNEEKAPFSLKFSAAGGPRNVLETDVKLIAGFGMVGRVLVNFVWEDGATQETRRGTVLKEKFREKAKEIEVEDVKPVETEEIEQDKEAKCKGKESGREKKGGIPKWFKPGKK